MLAKGVVLGAVAYGGYRFAAIPAASVLALTVAAASLVPYLGIVLIGLPIAALAGGLEVSLAWGLTVLGVHLVAQWLDVLLVRRAVQPRSVSVGPAASLIAVVVGLDVYGLGGALVALPAMILLLALLDEWLPEGDQSQLAVEPARTGPVLP
jgi:predicted PurR-regulated permease PerM